MIRLNDEDLSLGTSGIRPNDEELPLGTSGMVASI